MDNSDLLFWNVDTQNDFVLPEGKLYVKDAELLRPTWNKITRLAEKNNIRVVNTADFHFSNSEELSAEPDFISTFPEHCMANTQGAEYIAETKPNNPKVFDWDGEYSISDKILNSRNIVIRKDAFNVFKGNPYTESVLKMISPKIVVVYGVTTNVCVNDAVVGLANRVGKIFVIEDAIKELPNIPLPFENWKKLGVKLINSSNLEDFL
ncbi:isochorismatase family protein [Draconibacterium sp.]|nr:isochorismatase family protein [Draconibacterium sp.]